MAASNLRRFEDRARSVDFSVDRVTFGLGCWVVVEVAGREVTAIVVAAGLERGVWSPWGVAFREYEIFTRVCVT